MYFAFEFSRFSRFVAGVVLAVAAVVGITAHDVAQSTSHGVTRAISAQDTGGPNNSWD
ncbi:hypothetical protein [Kitasatospora sp. NPDC093102]|uniref:hypothetical protein n=1 Tax=Kitasatospora sp. NPDC093102 TaxID=3155069 RepID=UPI0034495546